jgi:hypothetical protein
MNEASEAGGASGVISIEEVLAEEAEILHGEAFNAKPEKQDVQEKRKKLNGDQRKKHNREDGAVQRRDTFYLALNKLNSAALCCSGGGIRSATFCLGVIQALAKHDVEKTPLTEGAEALPANEPATTDHHSTKTAGSKPKSDQTVDAKHSALGRFHYLSTVSGGGYAGSWLSAWRHRSDFKDIVDNLTGRPNGPDIEPPEISWLRAYSNYLTPKLGIASADSWAAVAICLRNLVLNWLVIIPIVCLVLLTLKMTATASVWIAHGGDATSLRVIIVVALGIFFTILAQAFTTRYRPARRAPGETIEERSFVLRDAFLAVLAAIAVTIFFVSHYFSSQLDAKCSGFTAMQWWDLSAKFTLPGIVAVAGLLIYAVGWIAGYVYALAAGSPSTTNQWVKDFFSWAASGLVYGAIVGFGAYLYLLLAPYSNPKVPSQCALSADYPHLLLPIVFGVPWVLMAQLTAEIVFAGLRSNEDNADADREWLGRAAGWLAAFAVAWALTAFLVFAGGLYVEDALAVGHDALVKAGGAAGIVSGILTALLGSSSRTPAKSSSKGQGSITAIACNVGLAVAGPIFVAVLIIALSVALDELLLGDSLVKILQGGKIAAACSADQCGETAVLGSTFLWLGFGWLILAAVELLASHFVNINRFSLHALYRNRLIRCYLGASNETRDPDLFSGFDFNDNICVSELWPRKSDGVTKQPAGFPPYCLFHVVNIALNVVSTKRLAWQERKAESFTVSPRHCGGAYLGFRKSQEYGGQGGLSLGTAMAISGAAVSPNMGYHSSPSIALLLTLFNVRLGWWLGNPGKAGDEVYTQEGPSFAARPLFTEAFGLTTDDNPYVYLSDGGHFENLGLYEMVRRRCRLIVVVDAGCDPDFAFEDLGNAVRKINIDLGVRITFEGLERLQNHPSPHPLSAAVLDAAAGVNREVAKVAKAAARAAKAVANAGETDVKDDETAKPDRIPYHAIGTIHYKEADHGALVENGYILYIKPAYHGTETSPGIRSYARANPDFPHESTGDQWFTESQLESYRSLGLDIANDILGHEVVLRPEPKSPTEPKKLTLHDALKALKVRT